MIKILLIDDHPLIIQGIKNVLDTNDDMSVEWIAHNSDESIDILNRNHPDIIIMDVSLKEEIDGIELLKLIRKRFGNIRALILSMYDEISMIERAIKSGANGYVTKSDPLEVVTQAIRDIINGELYISSSISGKVVKNLLSGRKDRLTKNHNDSVRNILSQREMEVFQFISEGYTTGEISRLLEMSVNTVESHKRKIKDKLQLTKSSDLLKYAIRWRIQDQS